MLASQTQFVEGLLSVILMGREFPPFLLFGPSCMEFGAATHSREYSRDPGWFAFAAYHIKRRAVSVRWNTKR